MIPLCFPGKSTLINSLLQQYISPVSPLRQTTIDNMLGVVTHEDTQVVFIDTPGTTINRDYNCFLGFDKN